MRERIKRWLGIDTLETKLDEMQNEKLVIMKTIEEIRNDVELLKKELTEINTCKVCIETINSRVEQIDNKLKELETFHKPLDVVSVETNESDIETTILNIINNEKDVCISDLLTYTNLNTRELYKILTKLEKSGKLKRKRKGKKVIIELIP
jgi:predicted transcriptional regulator